MERTWTSRRIQSSIPNDSDFRGLGSVLLVALLAGCSSSGSPGPSGGSGGGASTVATTGGSTSQTPVGGGTSAAGAVATGGNSTTGGTVALGGSIQPSGGSTATAGTIAGGGGSTRVTGGSPATGGFSATGGANGGTAATGGSATTGGIAGSTAVTGGTLGGNTAPRTGGVTVAGGTTAAGGTSARGGSAATGGARVGGTSGSGGTGASGGSTGTGGTGVSPGDGGTPSTCGTGTTPAANPFGCTFAWGVNGNPTSYLQFASAWAGYNIKADGTFPANGFDSGNWLKSFASTTAVPAYYAYILGYYGHANGLQDGNVNPGGPNLTNGMGPLLLGVLNAACPQGTICDQNLMVKAYAWYAAQTYAAYKKPVIWLLEGDFIQYSVEGSTSGLSYAQLGQLAAQIALAIKCNDPPAVVAENYSTWISSSQLNSYIGEMNTAMAALGTSYDMIWTTGKGTSANAGGSETWAALHTLTGKPILVDESFGLSAAGDSWANQTAATINARIAGGVVAANITTATPSYLQTNVTTTLAPAALNTTCF